MDVTCSVVTFVYMVYIYITVSIIKTQILYLQMTTILSKILYHQERTNPLRTNRMAYIHLRTIPQLPTIGD